MVFCLDRRRCFQACGHLRGQVQAGDAGVMAFKVFPEPACQGGGKLPQAAVIQCRLALLQVVHQQVTDRPAGQVVPVDQLLGGALARSCQLPQHLRCSGFEDPHPVEHPVEPRPVRHRLGMRAGLGVQQLQDVTNGDLPEHAALGADDDGAAVQHVCPRLSRDVRIAVAQLPQPGEPFGVPGRLHAQAQMTAAHHRACEPARAGPHHIGADHGQQGRRQPPQPCTGILTAAVQPGSRHRPPSPAGDVGSAGQPPVLPAVTGLIFQPVQQRLQPKYAFLLRAGAVRHERRASQPAEGLFTGCHGRRPAGGRRTRGKPGAHVREGQQIRRSQRILVLQDEGHDTPFPNSTLSTSGR